MLIRIGCAALCLLMCLPPVVTAQATAVRVLGRAAAEYPEGFTRITSIRELSGGRVLVADGRDKVVQLVDLDAGRAQKVGREGSGPGEYGLPIRLLPLAGDSTLLHDPMNSRFLIIRSDGTPGATLSPPEGAGLLARATPEAVDARWRFYFRFGGRNPGALEGTGEAYVVRFDRSTQAHDTIAVLRLPRGRTEASRQLPGGMIRQLTNKPLAAEDVAAIAPDGRVAIVRADPYRVEWIGPSGQKTAGPVTPFERIRVNDAEKEAHLRTMTRPGSITMVGPPGARAAPIGGTPSRPPPSRPSPPLPGEDPSSMEWPDYKPPFLAGAASVAGDGRLWVLRTRAHDDPIPMYDVFDASGRLAERVALPKGTRLVGFGAGTVYLARTDEDDLEYLQRYRP